MNADKHPEFSSSERDRMDVCADSADVNSHREEDEKDKNGIKCTEEETRVIKTEMEDMEDDRAGMGSEEDGFDEERADEDNEDMEGEEEEEEGDTLNEPQDLSLVDYSRYDGAALQDAHGATADEGEAPRVQPSGKLSCDICGLSCISVNVLLVHKRSHTGERPFHCNQCGASFTQKGNLLRHIKLHSGEKPFKCPMCSYACRRRDALSGHLRTHSVEKPFKCNHCNRSYKQRSSLEEHRERCHLYIQNKCPSERADDGHPTRTQMGAERALLLDRLASNVAKRKSSMPQKFTGDNGICLDLSFNHRNDLPDPPQDPLTPDGLHPQQPTLPGSDGSDLPPSHRPYPLQLNHADLPAMSLTNGHKLAAPLLGLAQQHLGRDGSQPPLMYSLGHLLNHQNGVPQPLPPSPLEPGAVPGGVYPCGHCRVVFLDYVMFTIHMGCHGFRDPLECNVCGHRSRDRYEFSSHIARGEHRLELK